MLDIHKTKFRNVRNLFKHKVFIANIVDESEFKLDLQGKTLINTIHDTIIHVFEPEHRFFQN